MRICIFSHTFPRFPGDTSAPFMENLAKALADAGHKVFVLVPYDSKFQLDVKRNYTLVTYRYIFPDTLHILGYSRTFSEGRKISSVTYLVAPFMYLFGLVALWRLVRKENIDVINAHWLIPNGFITRIVSFITRVPYVASIPGADVRVGGQNEMFRRMVGVASLGANYVVSDSSHYILQLHKLGFYPKNVDLIRYGVDTKKFKPTQKDVGILKNMNFNRTGPIVLAVGRMVVQKGFIYLVRAFGYVVKKFPEAKLLFIGDGYERLKLESEAERLGITKSVIFTGTISYDSLSKYYNIADIFVMPSIRDKEGNTDASPVAMMEAMSCGVPVVATRFSGNEDLVIKGETGFLVKEKDDKQIANAIMGLISSRRRRYQVQKEVRNIAEKNFSIESVSRKYINIFKGVLAK